MKSSAALLAAILAAGPQVSTTGKTPDLWVEAWLSTAGPYGEGWTLRLAPNGNVFLRVLYMGNPSGNLLADLDVGDEYERHLRAAIETHRFFDLPTDISPKSAVLHLPDFTMDVALGGKRHKVRLYDPKQLEADSRTKRFLAVWEALFEGLPMKPSW